METWDTSGPLVPPSCDDQLIWDIAMSRVYLPALIVADEISLFLLLERAPATVDELAKNLDLGARGTEALLGILTSLGFLTRRKGKFSLAEVSRNFLLPHSPYYWGSMLHRYRDDPITHAEMLEALRADAPSQVSSQPQDAPITESWETGALDQERAHAVTQAMHSHSFPAAIGLAQHEHFKGVKRLLDVGGGSGGFCIALALHNPEIQCTVMELPPVCRVAEEYIANYDLQDRIDTLSADMFHDTWPSGYDAVFFSNVLHDWGNEQCRYLVQQSFRKLPSEGRIYLHEMLLEDTKDRPTTTAAFSMLMMLRTKGKQFTAGELDTLLRTCGFENVVTIPSYGYFWLISARKP